MPSDKRNEIVHGKRIPKLDPYNRTRNNTNNLRDILSNINSEDNEEDLELEER